MIVKITRIIQVSCFFLLPLCAYNLRVEVVDVWVSCTILILAIGFFLQSYKENLHAEKKFETLHKYLDDLGCLKLEDGECVIPLPAGKRVMVKIAKTSPLEFVCVDCPDKLPLEVHEKMLDDANKRKGIDIEQGSTLKELLGDSKELTIEDHQRLLKEANERKGLSNEPDAALQALLDEF